MSDAVDITMEDIVAQYQDEVTKLTGDKLLLQAAVKILGDQKGKQTQQITRLTEDLTTAVDEIARLTDALDALERPDDEDEQEDLMPQHVPALAATQHIPYTLGSNDRDG